MNEEAEEELLRRPVCCLYCGQPAWVIGTKEGRAEVHCKHCGMFEAPVRELKLYE